MKNLIFLIMLIAVGGIVFANPQNLLSSYTLQAKKEDQAFKGFSVEDGRQLYFLMRTNRKGEKIGCTSCHTDNPKAEGLSKANKIIEPLAPSANSKRFTDQAKVEKWFTRNCKEVLDRLCTSKEKGDFINYMLSVK